MERSQLLRGVLDVAVLAVIAERDGYGYDIQRRLADAGFDGMGEATIYGTLRRLYRAGSLSSYSQPSDEGPHRRYYGLTDVGRRELDEGRGDWSEFAEAVERLLAQPIAADAARDTTEPDDEVPTAAIAAGRDEKELHR